MGYIYHDTLDREESGMQVTKLKETAMLSKMSLLPWLCFFQMPAHFSITQETSQGSMSLPFPWSICTIIAAALLDYLQFIPEGPVRQSPNALYKGSLRTENSSVPWPLHTCCARSSCTFMLLIDLACKYLLCWNQSLRFTYLIFPSSSQKTVRSHLHWKCLLLLNGFSLSLSFLSKTPRY